MYLLPFAIVKVHSSSNPGMHGLILSVTIHIKRKTSRISHKVIPHEVKIPKSSILGSKILQKWLYFGIVSLSGVRHLSSHALMFSPLLLVSKQDHASSSPSTGLAAISAWPKAALVRNTHSASPSNNEATHALRIITGVTKFCQPMRQAFSRH